MTTKIMPVRSLLPLLLLLSWAAAVQGQSTAAIAPPQAQQLVDRALGAELRAAQDPAHPMRYRLRKSTSRLTTTKEIIETKDGNVARLLSVNDKPLSNSEEQAEQSRLSALLRDPNRQQQRRQGEESDFEIVLRLLRMLPRAFLYQYAGAVAGPDGRPIAGLEKFTFRPNPAFSSPDLYTEALTAMTGEIWIDAAQERVTRLEGHVQQDTDYGWGILGKLDKGGWIVLEQSDVGGRRWRLQRVQMQMSLRILFKNKSFDTLEEMTQYGPVSEKLDYRQAIQMLRSDAGGR